MTDIREQLGGRRYSKHAWPAYRFTPGRDPHPTASPQGHSYHAPGEDGVRPPWIAAEDWQRSEAYLFGCDLYNHGYWWEAHEEWEGLWKLCARGSAQRSYLQGLIQVSARHLKLYLGHIEGVDQLGETSEAHLTRAMAECGASRFMGLGLKEWVGEVRGYYARTPGFGGGQLEHDASTYPYLQLAIE